MVQTSECEPGRASAVEIRAIERGLFGVNNKDWVLSLEASAITASCHSTGDQRVVKKDEFKDRFKFPVFSDVMNVLIHAAPSEKGRGKLKLMVTADDLELLKSHVEGQEPGAGSQTSLPADLLDREFEISFLGPGSRMDLPGLPPMKRQVWASWDHIGRGVITITDDAILLTGYEKMGPIGAMFRVGLAMILDNLFLKAKTVSAAHAMVERILIKSHKRRFLTFQLSCRSEAPDVREIHHFAPRGPASELVGVKIRDALLAVVPADRVVSV